MVAFCLSCFSNETQSGIIRIAQKISREHNCKVVFFSTLSDFYNDGVVDRGERKVFDVISVERFDAIILISESFKKDEEQTALAKRAHKAGIPVVAVDKRIEHCINLRYDYQKAFREVMQHMVEYHGYRTINFMGGARGNLYSDERLQMYQEVLEEHGIPFEEDRVFDGGFWEAPTREAMDQMLSSGKPMPRAIVCANDAMALAVIEYLQEHGYRVPEDVAISGFDGITMGSYNRPGLTTVEYDYDKMISTIFEIIAKTDTTEESGETIFIDNHLHMRGSCGCSEMNPVHMTTEFVRLRHRFIEETRFHGYMNAMVANLGNEKDLDKVITSVADYIQDMKYKTFWFCMNEDFYNYMASMNRTATEWVCENRAYANNIQVLRYDAQEGVSMVGKIPFHDLLPDLHKELESNDSLMVVPIHAHERTVGYEAVIFEEGNFTYSLFATFIINIRYLVEMQINRTRMSDLYLKDSLSNLYNRNAFNNIIHKVMERDVDRKMAVIGMDMDNLKKINDTFGHAEGDVALISLSEVVESIISADEIAARVGGDEFIIAFTGEEVKKRADEIVREIKEKLERYNRSSRKPYPLVASIGAYTNEIRGHSLDYFLERADDLMYKEKYRNRKEKGDMRT